MNFYWSQYTTIEVISVLTTVGTILLLWNKNKTNEVKWLIALELFILVWSVAYVFELGTIDLSKKILFAKLSYVGIAFVPGCYLFFTCFYTRKNKQFTNLRVFLAFLIPVITLLLVFTNEFHHLIWKEITPVEGKTDIILYQHGSFFWVFWIHTQLFVFMGIRNLALYFKNKRSIYRLHRFLLIGATIMPLAGNFFYLFGINPFPGFDLTTLSFSATCLIITIGIFNFRIFNIVPFARNKYIDTMEDGVIVVNSDGDIEDNNDSVCSIFGLKKSEFLYRKFSDVFQNYSSLSDIVREEQQATLTVTSLHTGRIYETQISPIKNKNGKIAGHILVFKDITQAKNIENELLASNKKLLEEIEKRERLIDDLDSFAHTVAHDLRNSIGAIINSSEILKENIYEENKELLFEIAELINESASKTMHVMSEILILGTVSHQQIEKKTVHISEVFDAAVKQLQPLIEKQNSKIIQPEKWPVVLGNSVWLEEVWMNYLSNSLKYGGTPPVIKVGFEPMENNMIRFWIRDNGKGITEEDKEKLYRKTSRLDPHSVEGYGFGLSIIKRIINKLGGEVGVNIDNGTEFFFTLPAHEVNNQFTYLN